MLLASNRSAIKAARFFDNEVDEVIPDEDDERIDINDIDIWIDPLDATQVRAQLTCIVLEARVWLTIAYYYFRNTRRTCYNT